MKHEKAASPRTSAIPLVLCGAAAALFTLEGLLRDSDAYDFPFVGYGGAFGLLHLRVFGIRIYVVMMMLGAVGAFRCVWARRRAYGLTDRQALSLWLACLGIGAVGGLAFEMIQKRTFFTTNVSTLGGIFLLAALMPLFAKYILKKDVWQMYALCLMAGLRFIIVVRLGCFMNGCCGAAPLYINGRTVILPVQLYECFCLLAIQAALIHAERRRRLLDMVVIGCCPMYFACRFLLEYLRKWPRVWLGMTRAQLVILAYMLIYAAVAALYLTLKGPRGQLLRRKDGERL